MRKNINNCLIISDIDGTLITPDFHIPEINIAAIRDYIGRGGHFTVATGRSIESARLYVDQIEINHPAIVFNGSVIYDYHKEQTVWAATLPASAKQAVPLIMAAFPDVAVEIHSDRDLFMIQTSPEGFAHVQNESLKYTLTAYDELPDVPWNKVLFASQPERLQQVDEFVHLRWGNRSASPQRETKPNFHCLHSNEVYYEMLPEGISKGTTLQILADHIGIPRENVFAIGDFYNDVELIRAAGYGALAGNAPDDIKPEAAYIAATCYEGATADFIRHVQNKLQCINHNVQIQR